MKPLVLSMLVSKLLQDHPSLRRHPKALRSVALGGPQRAVVMLPIAGSLTIGKVSWIRIFVVGIALAFNMPGVTARTGQGGVRE